MAGAMLALLLALAGVHPAWADGTGPGSLVTFNIPSEPLADALNEYVDVTGMGVFYNSGLAAGRESTAIKGQFTPAFALQTLLQGTGLTADYVNAGAFTLIPTPPVAPAAPSAADPVFQQYFGVVQAGIAQVFCGNAETVPGPYRVALRFWISPNGAIQHPELLGSTSNPARDAAITSALQKIVLSEPPPPTLPQPIVMLISPRAPDQTGDCNPQ